MDAASAPKRDSRDPLANNPFAVQDNNDGGNGNNNSGNNNNCDNKDNNHEFIQHHHSTDIPTKIRFHVVTNLTKKRGNFLNNANNVLSNDCELKFGDCNATGVAINNTTNKTNTIGATGVANNKTMNLANTDVGLAVNDVIGIGLGAVLSPATTATNKNKNIFYGEPNGTLHYPCTGSPTSAATIPCFNDGFDLYYAPARGCQTETE